MFEDERLVHIYPWSILATFAFVSANSVARPANCASLLAPEDLISATTSSRFEGLNKGIESAVIHRSLIQPELWLNYSAQSNTQYDEGDSKIFRQFSEEASQFSVGQTEPNLFHHGPVVNRKGSLSAFGRKFRFR